MAHRSFWLAIVGSDGQINDRQPGLPPLEKRWDKMRTAHCATEDLALELRPQAMPLQAGESLVLMEEIASNQTFGGIHLEQRIVRRIEFYGELSTVKGIA